MYPIKSGNSATLCLIFYMGISLQIALLEIPNTVVLLILLIGALLLIYLAKYLMHSFIICMGLTALSIGGLGMAIGHYVSLRINHHVVHAGSMAFEWTHYTAMIPFCVLGCYFICKYYFSQSCLVLTRWYVHTAVLPLMLAGMILFSFMAKLLVDDLITVYLLSVIGMALGNMFAYYLLRRYIRHRILLV